MMSLRFRKSQEFHQPYAMERRMIEAELSHGQTVRTDVRRVSLDSSRVFQSNAILALLSVIRHSIIKRFGHPQSIIFCEIEPLEVIETISPGDDGNIPGTLVIDRRLIRAANKLGLKSDQSFDIIDSIITSNGNIVLSADELTRLVPHDESREKILVLS